MRHDKLKLDGLVAATYTPLDEDGAVNPSIIGPMVEHLLENGVEGLYVCGSTGEGMSLSSDERKLVAEADVAAVDRRVPVIVLVGLKYTDTKRWEFQPCLELDDGRFDVVWGCDEMLLGALATGARGAIGSTYNVAAPLYRQIIAACSIGDLREARRLQALAVKMIVIINHFTVHPAMKAVLGIRGFNVGGCRRPLGRMSDSESSLLRRKLEAIGFFDWSLTTTVFSS